MQSISNHAEQIGIAPLCQALGVSRATYYRSLNPAPVPKGSTPRPIFNNALSESERQTVLQILHSERFVDQAPATVYATLLDEGNYFCSTRTMYRILNSQQEVRERRRQTSHPKYVKPQLKATAPNQVWSWDITKLLGPAKWSHFSLYVVLDIYSRYVVGWMLAEHEKANLAEDLLKESCHKQAIVDGQLTIHADRGTAMTSKQVALLLSDLGVTKTHSRPHVSNDNPFSESQFKTMKYRPQFPERFGSIQDARAFCRDFFDWYNNQHRHSGIGWMTPHDVHYGHAAQVRIYRQEVLDRVYQEHPERFINKKPIAPVLPDIVWINPPQQSLEISQVLTNLNQEVSQVT